MAELLDRDPIKGRAYFEELLSMPQPQLTHTGTPAPGLQSSFFVLA